MAIMILKLEESEFNGIKYLEQLVLDGTTYYNPNKNKVWDIYSQNSHEETASKI